MYHKDLPYSQPSAACEVIGVASQIGTSVGLCQTLAVLQAVAVIQT